MFPFFLALYNGSQVSIVALWATCFIEFKVHLIHCKHVPLLHNTVLFLCYEEDGLMAMIGPGIAGKKSFLCAVKDLNILTPYLKYSEQFIF